jgi:hypothetical protein
MLMVLLAWDGPAAVLAQVSGFPEPEKLRRAISVSWKDVELRAALRSLSESQAIPVFLDRRIDPNQSLDFEAGPTAVGEILYRIADQSGCGVCWLGPVAYFGPREAVASLIVQRERMLEQIRQLPGRRKRMWLEDGVFECPRLAQPAALLDQELRNLGLSDVRTSLPHDVWPAWHLPGVRTIDRLILLTFGFGLWPKMQNGSLSGFESFPVIASGNLRLRMAGADDSSLLAEIQSRFPDVEARLEKTWLLAEADRVRLYEIRRLVARRQFVADDSAAVTTGGREVLSGRIKGSLGQALQTAASGLSVELVFDPSLRPALLRQIDVRVNRVTHQELIERVLEGTELEYLLEDGKLQIRKKSPQH